MTDPLRHCERCDEDVAPDPWALTPDQQADLDARIAQRRAEVDALPKEPPF